MALADMRPPLRSGVALNFFGRICGTALALLFTPIYIRLLGVEAWGLIGLLTAYFALAAMLDLGWSGTLTRELAKARADNRSPEAICDLARSLEWVYWGLVAVGICTVVAAAPVIAHLPGLGLHLAPSALALAIALAGTAVVLQLLAGFYVAGLAGLERPLALNLVLMVAATVRYPCAAVVLTYEPSVEAFFLWLVVAAAFFATMAGLAFNASLPVPARRSRFRLGVLRGISRFSAGMSGIAVVTALISQLDKIVLGSVLPLSDFAYYAVASVITANLPMAFLPIFIAVFPRLSSLLAANDLEGARAVFRRSLQLTVLLLLPAAGTIAFFPSEVLFAWTGDPTIAATAASVLRVLTIGTALSCLALPPYFLALAAGRSGVIFRIYLAAIIGVVPALYLLSLHAGTVGGAAAYAAMYAVSLCAVVMVSVRRIFPNEWIPWVWHDVVMPTFAVGLAATLLSRVALFHLDRLDLAAALAAIWLAASGVSLLCISGARFGAVQMLLGLGRNNAGFAAVHRRFSRRADKTM